MSTWFTQHILAGVFSSLWTLVWHWGLGVGLIILLLFAAYISPFSKKYFVYAAGIVAIALFIYGYGVKDEHDLCVAKTKYVYMKTHYVYIKTHNGKLSAPVTAKPACDGPFDTRCW